MLINIYAHSIEAPKYIKQMLTDIKGEINKNISKLYRKNKFRCKPLKNKNKKTNKQKKNPPCAWLTRALNKQSCVFQD